MSYEAPLRGLIVVRSDREQGVNAAFLRFVRELYRVVGVVAACARNDGHTVVCDFNAELDDVDMLLGGEGLCLARSPADHDGVRAFFDLILDKLSETVVVNALVLVKRCDDGDACAGKKYGFHAALSFRYDLSEF